MAKILICIPAMDMVATGFCQSLAMLQKAGHEVSIMFQVGSLIYDARNRLAKQAIKMGADYSMWFDSDMVFEPDTMVKLLADNKPFVSGMYFRRAHPYTLVAFDDLRAMVGCRGPAPADPGYSKERRRRRRSGNHCLIKC